MLSYKGRPLPFNEKVRVYRNLHATESTGNWSIQLHKTGLVVAHADFVALEDVEFKVQRGGSARVKKTGQRNVHAFAIGRLSGASYIADFMQLRQPKGERQLVYYDPHTMQHFVNMDGDQVTKVARAFFAFEGGLSHVVVEK